MKRTEVSLVFVRSHSSCIIEFTETKDIFWMTFQNQLYINLYNNDKIHNVSYSTCLVEETSEQKNLKYLSKYY